MPGLRSRLFAAVRYFLHEREPRQVAIGPLGYMRLSKAQLEAALHAHRAKRWEDAVPLWQAYICTVPSDFHAHLNLGIALLALDRIPDAEKCAEEMRVRFPGNAETAALGMRICRKSIDAALRAGSLDAAKNFAVLLAAGEARASDVNLVIGLANIYRGRNDRQELRKTVRAYLKAVLRDPDRRLAALKLSRTIFAEFPNARVEPLRVLPRFEKMVRCAPAATGAEAWLLKVCATYARARGKSPSSLLETDCSRLQGETFVGLVRDRVFARKPFSLVRLGDGEANALAYEPEFARFSESDARERERSWWGKELSADARSAMTKQVNTAIWSADALGIPCAGRVLRDMDLKSNDVLNTGRSGRGIRAIVRAVSDRLESGAPLPMFVSFAIHQDLHKFDLYPALLAGMRDVVCVSSHEGLPDVLKAKFGVESARNITLRSAFSLRSTVEQAQNAYVLPEQCEDVVAALGQNLAGSLVIVAAGYLGKWIAYQAALRGGVALDLGSIPDYWMGKRTRGYLDLV